MQYRVSRRGVGRVVIVGVALLAAGFIGRSTRVTAADPPAQPAAPAQPADPGAMFRQLPEALAKTPGCLGVETAHTQSGKLTIFAFFENKAACKAWYDSQLHQRLSSMADIDAGENYEPLGGIPDDVPIMTVASVTLKKDPQPGAMPFDSIAIEMYTPMKKALVVNHGFAPDGFCDKVK